jgi:MFS family permease
VNKDLWIVFSSLLLWSVGLGLYNFTWPLHVQSLGASPVELGLLQSIMYIAMAVSYLPGGILADRYERRIQLVIGWAMTIPVPLMYAYAGNWRGMIPGAVLWGLSAFNGPTINAYITDVSPPERLATTLTTVWAAWPLGMVVSPLIGGVVGERYGMRLVYWISFILYTLSTFILFMAEKNWPSVHAETKPGPNSRWSPGAFFASFVTRRFLAAVGLFVFVQLTMNLTASFFGPYLSDALHFDLTRVGIMGSVSAAGAGLLAPLLGRFADRAGAAGGLAAGLLVLALSSGMIIAGWGLPFVVTAVFLRGIIDGIKGVMSAAIGREAHRAHIGKTIATYNLVAGLGVAAAPAIGGVLYGVRPGLPYAATAGLCVLLALIGVAFLRQPRRPTPTRESLEA